MHVLISIIENRESVGAKNSEIIEKTSSIALVFPFDRMLGGRPVID